MTCHKPGFGAELKPGLVTVVALSLHPCHVVVKQSSCRRSIAVVLPSYRCRRAVVSIIIISTRRDFSYPTSACLLNYANIYCSVMSSTLSLADVGCTGLSVVMKEPDGGTEAPLSFG